MASLSGEFTFDELWQHERFVRTTLRNLLTDENRVDDLTQETWLRALRQSPSKLADPRAWLGTVARNLARSSWRSEARRARREAEHPTEEASESTELGHEHIEMRQRVVQAILELEEPYRSVVVLRYEHDLSTHAIAERLGKSDATIRSQLSRAHEKLRTRLDREFGDRERWAVLALPASTTRAAGSLAWLIPIAAVTLVGSGAWLWTQMSDTSGQVAVLGLANDAAAPMNTEESVVAPAELSTDPVERTTLAAPERLPAQNDELLRPPAQLFDSSFYSDYELATFSFEWGLHKDPGNKYTNNDWEVSFANGEFDVVTVANDHSVIADLGRAGPRDLVQLDFAALEFGERATVQAGHAYFIGTRDKDTDLATFVFVRDHVKGRTCRFDWYTTDGSGRAQGSIKDPRNGRPWTELLADLRLASRRGAWLEQPRVLLQVRSGDSNGNPNRINMAGEASAYVDEVSPVELDLLTPVEGHEDSRAYFAGGWIPAGQRFVVTRIHYEAADGGESSPGWGRFHLTVGGLKIAELSDVPDPIRRTWTGRIELDGGDEAETYLMASQHVMGQAILLGAFEPSEDTRAFGGENRGFFKIVDMDVQPIAALVEPRVRLQLRAGAGGGNPNRVNLLGKTSIYVDERMQHPLDVDSAVDIHEPSLVYHETGSIDPKQTFVVTRIEYRGSARGDSNGPGEFKLVVGGETIHQVEETEEPIAGVWTGQISLLPGEETRTYLEIANSSAAEAILTGYFELKATEER